MHTPSEVLVIGAGVSGLTTAICLAEQGIAVRVRTRHQPDQTTSRAAGAIWGPYLVDDDRVLPWSLLTWSMLDQLADEGGAGVRRVHGLEAAREMTTAPDWATRLAGFRPAHPDELPAGFVSGWWYTAPVVDMPIYLDYLVERLQQAGGKLEIGAVASLPEAVAEAAIVVNCTGAGARDFVPDQHLTPTRGQLVVVENPGIECFFVEHDESPHPTYYVPHGDHVVLGGSAEPGSQDLRPDLAISAEIQRRCGTLDSSLATARVRDHRVGLRPTRPQVRLERTDLGSRQVIHNYGHGGSGVTLSWGCANEVVALVGRR